MKIFTTGQIAAIDQYTIANEPIAEIDLMERASFTVVAWILEHFDVEKHVVVFAGPGNNGGDALAIARQLCDEGYEVTLYLVDLGKSLRGSPAHNWHRLVEQGKARLSKIDGNRPMPNIQAADLVIDGLFGSGLTRPLAGLTAEVVKHINSAKAFVLAIDIPSGLMGQENEGMNPEHIVHADCTLTFQFPKLCFFYPENEIFIGKWKELDIGLHPQGIKNTPTSWHYLDEAYARKLIKHRSRFSHKGTYGHALLIAGSYGKMGAALLASRACLRAGAGLLTTHVPRLGYQIVQLGVPEAMVSIDQSDLMFTQVEDVAKYTTVAIGPGLDTKCNTQKGLHQLLLKCEQPMVIDADALNILAENSEWFELVPKESILTPHPGEFRRITGDSDSGYQYMQKAAEMATRLGVIVVLKGANSLIACPDGVCWFNSTGNPGMATAGSGDILTGILLGLLSQGYSPRDAALLGVFTHGLSGDLLTCEQAEESIMAGDIAENFGVALQRLKID